MSRYYRHLIEDGLLLDIYPNAAVAYSLRKLRSAYTGNSIRVRRSSDNTEQDFGFTSTGDLDVNSIENFVGYNLFSWSEQLQQAYWAKTNLTVTTDTLVAPDSTTTGDILFETTTNGVHVISRALAVTAGKEYTVSFWVQSQGRDNIRISTAINLSTDNTTIPTAWFDLSTGTKVSDNGFFRIAPTITPDTNGWFLITYGVTANATTTSNAFQINLSPNGTNLSYVGDVTKGIAVWGLQITESSSVKSYRKTLSVAEGGGFVTTYYDQSGNGNDLTNASSSLQYRIVVNGNTYRNIDNGLPATQVVSTGFYIFTNGSISTSNPLINFNVYKSTAASMILFGNSSVGGRPVLNLHNGAVGSRNIITRLTNSVDQYLTLPFETNGSFITSTTRDTSNYQEVSVNNSVLGGSSIGVETANISHLGRFNSTANSSGGEIQEMIIWKQDYVSLKTNISDKINEYYGIY